MLVSQKEKSNYQRIRTNLEKLKTLVDEAELWIMKAEDLVEKVWFIVSKQIAFCTILCRKNMSASQVELDLRLN